MYENNLLGLDRMTKKLWTVIDSPKTGSKEKIKAIVVTGQYYREKLQLVRNVPNLIEQVKRAERMKQWST
jgi:hypothetical protein